MSTETAPQSSKPNVAFPALFTFGGLASAFGVAACCAIPMWLSSLGIGVAWLAGIALFVEPLRDYFIWIAVAGLMVGGLLFWRARNATPAPLRIVMGLALILGAVLLYFGYTLR